jgi:hypothetical protein
MSNHLILVEGPSRTGHLLDVEDGFATLCTTYVAAGVKPSTGAGHRCQRCEAIAASRLSTL